MYLTMHPLAPVYAAMMFSFLASANHQDGQMLQIASHGWSAARSGHPCWVYSSPVTTNFSRLPAISASKTAPLQPSSTLVKPSSLSGLRTIRRMVEKSSTTRNSFWDPAAINTPENQFIKVRSAAARYRPGLQRRTLQRRYPPRPTCPSPGWLQTTVTECMTTGTLRNRGPLFDVLGQT